MPPTDVPPTGQRPTDAPEPPGAGRLLIDLEALVVDDPSAPRAAADAGVALERISWLGEPVVLAGDHVAGRRLPDDPDDRALWVRETLGRADIAVVAFEDPGADGGKDDRAVDRWRRLRDRSGACLLLTGSASSVGPARRAGLAVVHIGPRDASGDRPMPRADHEARDLLDAANQLLVADTFSHDPDEVTERARGDGAGR